MKRRLADDPVRLIPILFAAAIALGTVLLLLPIARAGDDGAPLMTAFFTATSAVAVTGLIVVDTPTYWSGFGQGVILLLFQVGGFGIMTAATLLGLVAGRTFRLRDRLATQVERNRLDIGDARSVLKLVLIVTLIVEGTQLPRSSPRDCSSGTTTRSDRRCGTACSTRSARSTMPASRATPTA